MLLNGHQKGNVPRSSGNKQLWHCTQRAIDCTFPQRMAHMANKRAGQDLQTHTTPSQADGVGRLAALPHEE